MVNTSDAKDKPVSEAEESYEIIQMSDEEKKDEKAKNE
jgi:hypothetical protein